jgi:hypothetical protein
MPSISSLSFNRTPPSGGYLADGKTIEVRLPDGNILHQNKETGVNTYFNSERKPIDKPTGILDIKA